MFPTANTNASFPKLEEEILRFWKERGIYEKSLAQRKGAASFVFFEGPPTANGMPHPGHCLTRAIKDLFPRYKTMRGYYCERKAGWDTHGLPVEVEVCKELGIHAKEEIEAFGIEPFIHKCQESVWRYMQEWERLTERLGFWIHLDEAYVTYHQTYVESVWWSLKKLFDEGLLYQGHKIVWWWAQGGTALSSGEVGQGYREVADPSVYVKFPLVDQPGTSLLVWTTTPWTLPSNQFAAVHPELDYATVVDSETNEKLIMASALVETIAAKVKRELKIESTCKGSELLGMRYKPPYDYYYYDSDSWGSIQGAISSDEAEFELELKFRKESADGGKCDFLLNWRVVEAKFVAVDSGTGVVHIAPAYGEDDYEILASVREIDTLIGENSLELSVWYSPDLINAVAPNGKFTDEAPEFCRGRWVKDCDKDIQRDLKHRGLLYHQEQYLHDYPFCWRAPEDPLIQYPRRSWFIKTTQFKDQMLANNAKINWMPEHIKEGRFGNFLESNVDWALSRERFWGTPLPVWVCEKTGKMEALGSYAELLAKPGIQGTEVWDAAKKKNPNLVEDLKVHKPYIDAVTYDSPFSPGARMRRVTEVIDCWYDSGAMPFAQWGYPHQNAEQFQAHFPADFISEAIDQTRGWFYSLLAISTMMFGEKAEGGGRKAEGNTPHLPLSPSPYLDFPHPYKNCIVLGLMLGEDGQKMSKSKRNYREPNEIFNKYGADALRWYFYANQPPWTSIRYKEQAIKDSIPEFLLRLWNCYTFFLIYANIDGFDPAERLAGNGDQLSSADLAKGRGYRPIGERSELDRWILSELNRTLAAVVERMDAYDNFEACKRINEFVDGLSNWYVRRSRDRFWSSEKESPDKLDAYWTLYECLLTSSKMIAPFVPFLAETLWQNLAGIFGSRVLESVHLCDYPTGNASVVDDQLSAQMRVLREIASLGRAARMDNKLKVRQPLASVHVILSDASHQAWLTEHEELLRDELNVKQIDYIREAEKYITYLVQPNFKRLGPRVGKLLPGVKQVLGQANGAELLAELSAAGKVTFNISGEKVELDNEDIQVRLQAKAGWAAAQGAGVVVVLNTELTPELIAEGLAKDAVRLIQDRRKAMNLDYTDRIAVGLVGASAELQAALQANAAYIQGETLADSLVFAELAGDVGQAAELGDFSVTLFVQKK